MGISKRIVTGYSRIPEVTQVPADVLLPSLGVDTICRMISNTLTQRFVNFFHIQAERNDPACRQGFMSYSFVVRSKLPVRSIGGRQMNHREGVTLPELPGCEDHFEFKSLILGVLIRKSISIFNLPGKDISLRRLKLKQIDGASVPFSRTFLLRDRVASQDRDTGTFVTKCSYSLGNIRVPGHTHLSAGPHTFWPERDKATGR